MPPVTNQNIQAESRGMADNRVVYNHQELVSVANVNAGYTLLPPNRDFKYRIVDMSLIAVGGAASGATAVTINGTALAAAVALLTTAIAALTQNAINYAGLANNTILAAGASFTPLDVNTGVTIGKTGGTLATATGIMVSISYCLEKA